MMRIVAGLSVLALIAAAPALGAMPAPAQPTAAAISCDGQIAILYHSKIKQGGSIEGVMDAAKAQEAWYRAQGITDNRIVVARVVTYDKATRQQSYASDEVYNLHINPPARDRYPASDGAAKPDYVAKFRANASLIEKRTICLPKL